MNYPLISEYVEAIKAAEDNFDQMKHLRPVLGDDGEPVMTSGNFAVVFKMKDEQTGKLHAVKCFLKEQEGRAEAYRQIAEELEFVSSTFLTPIKYLDKELFVDSANSEDSEFPVLLMDWVEGQTLDKYIREHIDDQYELSLLAYQFSRLAMWLMPQPFAHGDLKPDNILVKEDGTLVLVDYDGMYVPAMKGQKARELGSPDFRHPGRTEEVFDDHIDDFSLASILLSLKAIALQPSLLEEYGASDRLLFSERDYRNLSESSALGALQPLMQDAELASLYSLYILALSQNNLSQVSFRLFNLSRPDKSQYEEENLSTEVTEEDLVNAWVDESGAMYSADRKRLLKAPKGVKPIITGWSYIYPNWNYTINTSTVIICDYAFQNSGGLNSVTIPQSVKVIGKSAFENCNDLSTVIIPYGVFVIEDSAFSGCRGLECVSIPRSVIKIGEYAFSGCESLKSIFIPSSVKNIGNGVFACTSNLSSIVVAEDNKCYDSRGKCNAIVHTSKSVLIAGCASSTIPNDLNAIGDYAFVACKKLIKITIPDGIIKVGKSAFHNCVDLQSTKLPNSLRIICDNAFEGCKKLETISLPDNLITIGEKAFNGCGLIENIKISKSVNRIGFGAFSNIDNLQSIIVDESNKYYDSRNKCNAIIETDSNTLIAGCSTTKIPFGIKKIDNCAFMGISIYPTIDIPDTILEIGDSAFRNCNNLESIIVPNSVLSIGKSAFSGCENIQSICLSNGITKIEDGTFLCCSNLNAIAIPTSVTCIGNSAFYACRNLSSIIIPDSVSIIEREAFDSCCQLTTIIILGNIEEIKDSSFEDCECLRNIILPNSIQIIRKSSFSGCGLSSIQLPQNLVGIEDEAFSMTELSKIYIPFGKRKKFERLLPDYQDVLVEKTVESFQSDNLIMEDVSRLYLHYKNIKTENKGEKLEDVWTDEYGVKYTRDKKLIKAQSLEEYSINNGTEVICDWAFVNGISPHADIEKITFPNSVRVIGDHAFYHGNLEFLIIPNGVIIIGKSAFENCHSLDSLIVSGSVIEVCEKAFCNCYNITSICLCNGIRIIGEKAFAKSCKSISTLYLPNSIEEIDDYAFEEWTSLISITMPDSIRKIGTKIFDGCEKLKYIIIPYRTKEKYEELLPEYKDKLVEQYEEEYFSTEVTDEDLANAWTDEHGVKYSADRKKLLKAPANLAKYSIRGGTIVICDQAFSNLSILFSVKIPYTVTTIGFRAFWGCGNIGEIALPAYLEFVGGQAFGGCAQLNHIFIPLGTSNKYKLLLASYEDKVIEQSNGWKLKAKRFFYTEEISAVNSAKVVQSQYGLSVCFHMNDGCQKYIPLSNQSRLTCGGVIDVKKASLITLSRPGDDDIYRVLE